MIFAWIFFCLEFFFLELNEVEKSVLLLLDGKSFILLGGKNWMSDHTWRHHSKWALGSRVSSRTSADTSRQSSSSRPKRCQEGICRRICGPIEFREFSDWTLVAKLIPFEIPSYLWPHQLVWGHLAHDFAGGLSDLLVLLTTEDVEEAENAVVGQALFD